MFCSLFHCAPLMTLVPAVPESAGIRGISQVLSTLPNCRIPLISEQSIPDVVLSTKQRENVPNSVGQ